MLVAKVLHGSRRDTFFEVLHDLNGKLQDMLMFEYPAPVHSPAFGGSPLYVMEGVANVEPALGMAHVHVFVKSCGGLRGEGVVFSTPDALPHTVAFYDGNGAGFPTAGQAATSGFGIGGLLHVPIGTMTLEARLEKDGQLVAKVPLNVREGLMTAVNLAPGPR